MLGFLGKVLGVGGAFEACSESQVEERERKVKGEESPPPPTPTPVLLPPVLPVPPA